MGAEHEPLRPPLDGDDALAAQAQWRVLRIATGTQDDARE